MSGRMPKGGDAGGSDGEVRNPPMNRLLGDTDEDHDRGGWSLLLDKRATSACSGGTDHV